MRRICVAVVFGGRSSEHAISCVSGGGVLAALDRSKYEVLPVGITSEGAWVLERDDPARLRIADGRLPEVDPTGKCVVLPGDPTLRASGSLADVRALNALAGVDVVFPVLHGPWGEDGTIQGLLELAGLPYVGSGVFASAAAMDKGHMKAALAAAGLEVGPYVVVTDRQWRDNPAAVLQEVSRLEFPVFVKPARAGSSVGITRVTSAAGLQEAIEVARGHDPRVICEQGMVGIREIECGVIDGSEGPRSSACAEIVVRPGRDFYDFAAKYLDDAVDLTVPAELAVDVLASVQEQAIRAFEALGCEGLARVDFFVTPDGRAFVNEVNTMPGFTPKSMFPRMWESSGLTFEELVEHLVSDALRRGTGLR